MKAEIHFLYIPLRIFFCFILRVKFIEKFLLYIRLIKKLTFFLSLKLVVLQLLKTKKGIEKEKSIILYLNTVF